MVFEERSVGPIFRFELNKFKATYHSLLTFFREQVFMLVIITRPLRYRFIDLCGPIGLFKCSLGLPNRKLKNVLTRNHSLMISFP